MSSSSTNAILERIRTGQAKIGVIGLGYVGLPLAVEFAGHGFDVTGFDVDEDKAGQINAGRSYIVRESPALDIIELLVKRGAKVTYTDPWVPKLAHGGHELASMPEAWALDPAPDCAVVCTHHSAFDYAQLVASGALVVDTRNALKGHQSARIFRL